MKFERSSGIILHPTSFPGPDGMGDIGPEAYHWINTIIEMGCSLWQILPLGPTGYGDSPYQCFSAFAGNPYLISSVLLREEGFLSRKDFGDRPEFPDGNIQYGEVIHWKLTLLDRAYKNYQNSFTENYRHIFEVFTNEQSFWLDDFAMFMAIKEANQSVSWNQWPLELRLREQNALKRFKTEYAADIERHAFRQFLFFRQWNNLRKFANEKKIKIIGDIPIFVAYDSADAWAHPELFHLDNNGDPTVVAGVPPDYFSPTGQLWGNPIYRWEHHKDTGYAWWIQRIKTTLDQVDIIRLDHFRGFAGYWEIPAGMPTAEIGKWVSGPGDSIFNALEGTLGKMPIIAEDLGRLTPDVIELRDKFGFPGMKILQFSFDSDSSNPFLPHNFVENCVAYTGTHDNDTTLGWYKTAPQTQRDFCRRYLASSGNDISWDMIRAVWRSVAIMTLAPIQDILSLGTGARMNYPGKPGGNWNWRMQPNAITLELIERVRELNHLYGRESAF
ncbi:MAG: 4-alpha-glucanotransferase [Anaerolineaceae bacterium]|nr:4-alpha-glucanotransferase [Anaerolineaceae bacterium]